VSQSPRVVVAFSGGSHWTKFSRKRRKVTVDGGVGRILQSLYTAPVAWLFSGASRTGCRRSKIRKIVCTKLVYIFLSYFCCIDLAKRTVSTVRLSAADHVNIRGSGAYKAALIPWSASLGPERATASPPNPSPQTSPLYVFGLVVGDTVSCSFLHHCYDSQVQRFSHKQSKKMRHAFDGRAMTH
jgi:hypothetical protein